MRSCQSCCAALAQMFRCATEKQVPKQSKQLLSPWRIELPSLQLEQLGPGRFQMNSWLMQMQVLEPWMQMLLPLPTLQEVDSVTVAVRHRCLARHCRSRTTLLWQLCWPASATLSLGAEGVLRDWFPGQGCGYLGRVARSTLRGQP